MISRLISIVISTSLLSTLVVVVNLIVYFVTPTKLYVLFCNMLMGKMDVNAVLTSLNSREFVRGNSDTVTLNAGGTIPLATFRVDESQTFTSTHEAIGKETPPVGRMKAEYLAPV
ncbi:hypothetical protein C8Q77DRAFT_1209157 [Trametes polyzona]|nr:hypothetical protein C8Q77DRAFT_1209157 [Trametes polyzona]